MRAKVLIVDDSRLARMAVIRALSRLQPELAYVEAAGADEAVSTMLADPAHIAIVDFNMPGRDGLLLVMFAGSVRASSSMVLSKRPRLHRRARALCRQPGADASDWRAMRFSCWETRTIRSLFRADTRKPDCRKCDSARHVLRVFAIVLHDANGGSRQSSVLGRADPAGVLLPPRQAASALLNIVWTRRACRTRRHG